MTLEKLCFQAEQQVLGGILLVENALPSVADKLKDRDFGREAHANIFAAMKKVHERGE